ILYRYVLNSLISLAIIYVAFKNIKHVKFAGFFLMLAFMILIFVFVYLLREKFEAGYLFPFYIRRFLIHPMFLLLLLPAFYYQTLRRREY
ncbi:MAG: exosortase F system-associated protein, partial [Flavobacteriaceae bacterium]|nr:exosortase F system-associated protein [Flavobacteriaceae bacterium]